jgi:predicted dehydrogenase
MKILFQNDWRDGFLDPWRAPEHYRIRVTALANLERLGDLYFVPKRSARMLLNYLRELGPLDVMRKVLSRSKERRRNEKFLSIGLGVVLEAPASGNHAVGSRVLFIAPCHPACQERLVLPESLLAEALQQDKPGAAGSSPAAGIAYLDAQQSAEAAARRPGWWKTLQGWNEFSGRSLADLPCEELMRAASDTLMSLPWSNARTLPADAQATPDEQTQTAGQAADRGQSRKLRGVLFGHGNYAKTMTVPTLMPVCDLVAVHEIDPAALPASGPDGPRLDTSPWLRPDETVDVCMIAGFHHTHAPLAVDTMRRGAIAVVEKPIATTVEQLDELVEEMRRGRGRIFGCFQKRYHPFNELAYQDLQARPGDPISYHCLVYEVPVPRLHWYAWPNSGSRIISNGCHWIDHFLHLNPGAAIVSQQLTLGPDETVNCSVTLDSGAMFTMVLTDRGSARLGVREHAELRANGATVTMTDGCVYRSENTDRVLRSTRVHRYAAHRAMYRRIGERIAAREPGDSLESIERSTALVLSLEQMLQEQRTQQAAEPVGCGEA